MIYSGLDLGAAKDFSALACVDRQPFPDAAAVDTRGRRRWRYEVRHLQTWELGTDYVRIADDVKALFDRKQLTGSALVPDYTGVGRPVFDLLKTKRVRARMVPVLTTGGKVCHQAADTGVWSVPKTDLVSTLQVLLQGGYLKIEQSLPLAGRLQKELSDFRVTITKARNETFGAEQSQHDDLCIPAGVPVLTARGWVGIERVTTADDVLTRDGWKPVVWAGMTAPAADTIAIECGNAGVVECTLSHPVFVLNRGWVAAADIRPGDEVLTCPQWKRSSGADGFGGGTRSPRGEATVCTTSATPSGRLLPSGFTGRCGGRRTGTSRPGTTSTTATRTRSTTTSTTWSASRSPSTGDDIGSRTARPSSLNTFAAFGLAAWLDWLLGESRPKGSSSFAGSDARRRPPSPCENSGARRAGSLFALAPPAGSTARSLADSGFGSTRRGTPAPVPIAAPGSWPTSPASVFVPAPVRRVRGSRRSVPVFNLTVADCPEFFAGGVLVHNCFAVMLAVWLAERDGGGLASEIGTPPPGRGTAVEAAPQGVFLS